jgi:uncharacterized protein
MEDMTGKSKTIRRKPPEEEIDKIVEAQADDDSAWEAPIQSRRDKPAEAGGRNACEKEGRTSSPWEVNSEKVEAAVRKIIEISRPVKLILFGSYVRGEMNTNSDLDVLVVARDGLESPRKESVRIRRALRGISMPMDILVVPQSKFENLKDVPGLVYREAVRRGKVVYESR